MPSEKLKYKDIKSTRLALLEQQEYRCAICGLACTIDQAVLDHCHKNTTDCHKNNTGGHIRAVLHRGCNALLGRIENNAPRHGIQLQQLIAFLVGASRYIDFHQVNQTGLIHPLHLTPEEKAARRKAKARRARAKNAKPKGPAKG